MDIYVLICEYNFVMFFVVLFILGVSWFKFYWFYFLNFIVSRVIFLVGNLWIIYVLEWLGFIYFCDGILLC